MGLLPSSPDTSAAEEANPQVVGVDSDRADALMTALSSTTAREILTALHDEPVPASALADRVDTTLQNVQYHLERLEAAGVVEVIDTVYSEKGREMDIYAPTDRPLVIFAGRDEQSRGLRDALRSVLSGLAAVALGAVVVQELFGRSLTTLLGGGGDETAGGGAAPQAAVTPSPTPTPGSQSPTAADAAAETAIATGTPEATGTAPPATPAPTEAAAAVARTATETAAAGGGGVPPGLVFFVGGVLALAVVALAIRR